MEIIAHRGASADAPENTLAAFRRAIEVGADAVELDVHLTRDGVLVVHHDPTLGPGGPPIAEMTIAEVRAARSGDHAIPTFDEVMALLDGRLRVCCELKGAGSAAAAVQRLSAASGAHAVHAFDHREVQQAQQLAPQIARGVLEYSRHIDPTMILASVDAGDLWQRQEFIDATLVAQVHAVGKRVVAWTVNDAERARTLAALGVDGLCTDDPRAMRRAVG
ncbi:MAG: glycerophosphodiester phosphodiesterase [Gemmatimonadaceae bacterium]|nr:glycerophosphodiester phosphodiesterase [Gemmatimonadaceae bacterium]